MGLIALFEAWRDLARGLTDAEFWILFAIGVAMTLMVGHYAWRWLHRARLIEDTPTALMRSAAQGYVEFDGHGTQLGGERIRAPLSSQSCLWWRFVVEEKVRRGRHWRWRVIEREISGAVFALDDPSGRCIIDPEGAEVTPSLTRRWYGDTPRPRVGPEAAPSWGIGLNFRYTESLVEDDLPLYVIGWFETLRADHYAADLDLEVARRLRGWKGDPRRLAAFDADGDRKLDGGEWEAARIAARREVDAEAAEQIIRPGVPLMRRPADGRPFIISTLDQHALARRLRWRGGAATALLMVCAWSCVTALSARLGG